MLKKLSKLQGVLFEIPAKVSSCTTGRFDPKVGTPLQKNLNLKLQCRVILTYNLDVSDSLTNGSQGRVVGFEYENNGDIRYV